MAKVLSSDFFDRSPLQVSPDLLGKVLLRRLPTGQIISGLISEVEAYDGPEDLACHASKGRTPRTEVMFGPPGHFYVYFVYGIHWMVNIVTGPGEFPSAVLIRGTLPVSGPGRLTQYFSIDKTLNGAPVDPASGLWVEDHDIILAADDILTTPRIGVDYAAQWANKPYRYVLDNPSRFL